jgi:general secretion pathway protein G
MTLFSPIKAADNAQFLQVFDLDRSLAKQDLAGVRARMMRGFTLIEIMVVVTLMAILMGLGATYLMKQLDRGKVGAARTQCYEIAKALDLYKLQVGNYPSASEGLEALVSPPRGKPIMDDLPLDPWGNAYNYAIPGTKNPKSFDVWSSGPGGSEEDEPTIGNWPEE